MVEYTFFLTIKNRNDPPIKYSLDLQKNQENSPEQLLKPDNKKEIKRELDRQIQTQEISSEDLETVLKTWIKDIKEGYRMTEIILDLSPPKPKSIQDLQEIVAQETHQLLTPDLREIEPHQGVLPSLDFKY